MKEIQLLNVTRGGGNDTKNDYFYLEFGGQITQDLAAWTQDRRVATPSPRRSISSRTVDEGERRQPRPAAHDLPPRLRRRRRPRLRGQRRRLLGWRQDRGRARGPGRVLRGRRAVGDARQPRWTDVTFSTTAGNLDQLSISVSRDAAGPRTARPAVRRRRRHDDRRDDDRGVDRHRPVRAGGPQHDRPRHGLHGVGRVTDDGSEGIEWLERRTGTATATTLDTNAGDLPMIAICGDGTAPSTTGRTSTARASRTSSAACRTWYIT